MNTFIVRTKPDAQKALGLGSTAFHERVAQGLIPKPFKLGAHASGLLSTEIETIIRAWAAGLSQDELRMLVAELTAERQYWLTRRQK
jgi:prophage regulatory protein